MVFHAVNDSEIIAKLLYQTDEEQPFTDRYLHILLSERPPHRGIHKGHRVTKWQAKQLDNKKMPPVLWYITDDDETKRAGSL